MRQNSQMKFLHFLAFAVLVNSVLPFLHALEKQPASVYHARRVALALKLHGGFAVLFAGEEALVDFAPYRQDSDFYYLTGWDEPGAALLVVAEPESPPPALDMNATQTARKYTEILFLPTRNLRSHARRRAEGRRRRSEGDDRPAAGVERLDRGRPETECADLGRA